MARHVRRTAIRQTLNPGKLALPHRYGVADTLGALNEITPRKILEAAALVKLGNRYQLAQILDDSSPAQMWRFWKHSLILDRVIPGRFLGKNQQSFVEESVAGALHSGTHLDGLGHIGIGPRTYNGYQYSEIITSHGLTKLGIEDVPPIFSRGILLDIASLMGVAILDSSYVITADDLDTAAVAQAVNVRAGDILLIHTGWGTLWGVDNERYKKTEPGIGLHAAKWCTDRRVAVIGCDNWAVEAVPGDSPDILFAVHQHCITRYGCYLLENVVTKELARDRVSEFCCVILPNRLRGASASMVSPLALT